MTNQESTEVMSSKPELLRAISDYKVFLQKTSTRGSYKKVSIFLGMVVQLLEEEPIDKRGNTYENSIVINTFLEQTELDTPLVDKQLPNLVECRNKKDSQLENNNVSIAYRQSPSTDHSIIDSTWGLEAINVIDKYIEDKKSGIKILFENETVSKTRWTKVTPVYNKAALKRFFKRVIKVRLKTAPIIGDFEIWSLNLDDIVEVVNEYIPSAGDLTLVRHFVAWMIQQPECPETYQATLKNVYLQMPENSLRHSARQKRVWLSRRDYLIILLNSLKNKGHLGPKRGIYVGLTGFCALRKIEAMLIRVGDFVLDDSLLLKNMNGGYGQLIVPRSVAKGESASIAPYHVAVVPRLRDLINEYLQSDFMEGYDKNTFLMRTLPVFEDDEFFDYIKEVDLERGEIRKKAAEKGSDIMNAIVDQSRMFLQCSNIKTPSTHDLRRTINQFILQCHLVHPLKAERAAEIHLRHKEGSSAKNRTTNRTHYQEVPTLAEYILCIDSTLNFPWDIVELEEWEKQNIRYTTIGVNDPEINSYPISDARQFSDTRLEENTRNGFFEPYGLKKNDKEKLELQMQIKHLSDLLKQPNTRNRINLQIQLTKLRNKLERMEKDD